MSGHADWAGTDTSPSCRCHRPLRPPSGQHWYPQLDPEPGPRVQAVALHGDDPQYLRRVRVPGGWHGRGHAANHPDATPPVAWAQTGQCWAGHEHPVIDVTAALSDSGHLIVISEPIAPVRSSRPDRRR